MYIPPAQTQTDGGPWSAGARTRRALADLLVIAQRLDARRCRPLQICAELVRQAALHRLAGVVLPADVVLLALRQLPAFPAYDPLADLVENWCYLNADPEAEGIDASGGDDDRREWGRRAEGLRDWLGRYSGTWSAERVVRAAEREFSPSKGAISSGY